MRCSLGRSSNDSSLFFPDNLHLLIPTFHVVSRADLRLQSLPQMEETCGKAEQLLNSIFERSGFDVRAEATESDLGCLLAINGADSGLLLNQGGELLDALQQILNQALGRNLPRGQRIVCDANNFRAAREAELRAMAEHAARQVRETSAAFVFGPMESNERRVIHLSLAAEEDLVTESIGEGNGRRLRVTLKGVSAQ